MLVFEEGNTEVPREKTLVAEKITNNKLNPHMMPGGEHSHHCAIPAPLFIFWLHNGMFRPGLESKHPHTSRGQGAILILIHTLRQWREYNETNLSGRGR